jgi:aryl-alcohol dehydrogenase-like predicted oxidoreductase
MKRQLGSSGVEVSAMGVGTWAIGGLWDFDTNPAGWGEVDDDESVVALRAAFERGITFYDTAANYGAGHAERIVARAFAGKRDEVVIATKFGYRVDEAGRTITQYDRDGEVIDRLAADCEASLRRLEAEVIDLFQFHVNEYPVEKAGDVRDALEELVAAGKILYYGWSTDNAEGARVFAAGEHCVAVQANLNVVHDSPEILAVCDEFDVACINRGPLGMGLLTGKYSQDTVFGASDVRSSDWFKNWFHGPIMESLPAIRKVLTSGGRTLAQGALAWLWARSGRTIPIPGIRTIAQVEENAGAMTFGPLTKEQMSEIEALLDRAKRSSE